MGRTVDQLQKILQAEVFHYAQDSKKAAGRALGTFVEIITYYKVAAWGFRNNILIERKVPEFGVVGQFEIGRVQPKGSETGLAVPYGEHG